jgi:hypothetical protein
MRLRLAGLVWIAIASALLAAPPIPQQPAETLRRTFVPGAAQRYVVFLHINSLLAGQRPEQIGAKQYVQPFRRSAQGRLSWRVVRRVAGQPGERGAEIEESLDEFSLGEARIEGDEEAQRMAEALRAAPLAWNQPRTIRYRETLSGQLLGVPPDAAPSLGENAPPLLTLWLLRAVRPTAALPQHPVRFGQRWAGPRVVNFVEWADVAGTESVEWLEAPAAAVPSVRLHVVQQITGKVVAGAERREAGDAAARFYAEMLSTLALDDARLLAAERSASREISWELRNVPGLAEPQHFRAQLSVKVEIHECGNDPCLAADRLPEWRRRN